MTVSELIQQLQTYPGDMRVLTLGYEVLSIVHEHIDSGVSWGNHAQFVKMQNRVLEKIEEAYDMAFGHD